MPKKKTRVTASKKALTEEMIMDIADDIADLLEREIELEGDSIDEVAIKLKAMLENIDDSKVVTLTDKMVDFYEEYLADLDNLPNKKEAPKEMFPIAEIQSNLEKAAHDILTKTVNEATKVKKEIQRDKDASLRAKAKATLIELQKKQAMSDFDVAAAMERKKVEKERAKLEKLNPKRLRRGRKKETIQEAFHTPSKATYAMMVTLARPELGVMEIYDIMKEKIATVKVQEVRLIYYFTKKVINYLEFKGMLRKSAKETGEMLNKEEPPPPIEKLRQRTVIPALR
jgi:hypothetical protein